MANLPDRDPLNAAPLRERVGHAQAVDLPELYNVGMNTSTPLPEPELSEDDVQACVRVLRAIEADRSHLTRMSQEQRRELLTLAGLIAKPERHDLVKMAKAFRRAEREAKKEQDRRALEQAGLRVQRRAEVYAPLWLEPPKPEDLGERPELNKERACYVCKKPFVKVHRYYDSMCEDCGDFNYAKREQTADLSGRYALVTGARVKIGFQASLKLLRAGAHVIVTTRFPIDAADRYSKEPDYASVPRAAADPRARPAAYPKRRAVHAVSRRAVAEARLHPEQRVPDGAAAGGVLSAPARARGGGDRHAAVGVARAAREPRRAARTLDGEHLPGWRRGARRRLGAGAWRRPAP